MWLSTPWINRNGIYLRRVAVVRGLTLHLGLFFRDVWLRQFKLQYLYEIVGLRQLKQPVPECEVKIAQTACTRK